MGRTLVFPATSSAFGDVWNYVRVHCPDASSKIWASFAMFLNTFLFTHQEQEHWQMVLNCNIILSEQQVGHGNDRNATLSPVNILVGT
jgi:hypothetical protein